MRPGLRAPEVVDKRMPNYAASRGTDMAAQGNFKYAEKTYSSFLNFMKWGTIISVGLAAVVVLLIAS